MKILSKMDSLDNVQDGSTRKLITKTTSSGTGNVVSDVSVSGDTITYTKGVNAVTDANYVHTDNNFTTTLKNKLDGIAIGAEVNQNAFSNVKVGSTTIAADSKTDTLELVAGSNVTLTPDATNDKVTIAATDTTYESKAAASGGTDVSLVTTGEKYTWNNKQNALSTQTAYSAKGTATKVPQITTNTLGQVTKIEEVTITQPTVNNGTLTIQKNGTNVQTFSANQSGNATANITVPTKTSELTNDSGYTTNTGTITGVSINGTSVATSGVANITSIPANIITPIATKTYTDIIGDSNDNALAKNSFYFGSVRPDSYTTTWEVRYRVRTWVPNNTNYETISEILFLGNQSSVNSYAIFNHVYNTSYRPVYYNMIARLKSAGYTAGYGHALGISLSDSNSRGDTSLKRSCTVDLLSCKNCAVTLNNTAVKWADWTGTGSTNYNDPGTYNASSNGLQETGDNDDTCQLRSYYQRALVGTNTLYGYSLCSLTNDDKLQGFVLSKTVDTGKSKNTATFRIGAPIFYYGSNTDKASGSYTGDNTLYMQTSGIDLRYSTNCAKTLTSNKPVYLVGVPSGSTYTLADTWWTQTLPSSDDGKIYIYLGVAYNTYQIVWEVTHPIYWYKNGGIKLYETPITSSDVTTALGYTPYSSANPNGYTSNTGTITGITMNGASKGTSGVVDLGTVITSHQSIKTINNNTITGTGNVSVGTITGVSVNGTSVATSGTANITSIPASILSGAIPSAVTATTQSQGNNSTKIATTAYVDTAISNLPEPMKFKGTLGTGGTVTSLPTTGVKVGDTYKVITAGTYASQAAKVGDMFIASAATPTWTWIPSGDDGNGTVTSVTIKATSPIAIDSSSAITTSGERTISHANSGVTAGTYRSVTVNATGHVTAGTNPTTLSGYGITDAKIASGVITLGSNTITPLTASSTLDATKVSGTLPTSTYTDTKNTAGSTDSSSKLFLIGATSQAANPQTYSQDTAYVDTNGHLYSNSKQVVNLSDSQALTNKTYNGYTLAAACAKAVVTSIDTSASLPTSNAVKTFVEGKGYVTTDTKNTAGSTDTSSKIFLIGATSQAANPQTYSDNEVYATSGVLTTKSVQVGGTAATMQYNSTDQCIEFVFA